jgi:hypothetical protein
VRTAQNDFLLLCIMATTLRFVGGMELQHRFVTMALVEVSVVEDIIGVYFNIL